MTDGERLEAGAVKLERVSDRLGQAVAVGDEVWDLGCLLECKQNLERYGTIYVRRLPVVDVFSWGVRLRKPNGDEIDSQLFERVVEDNCSPP